MVKRTKTVCIAALLGATALHVVTLAQPGDAGCIELKSVAETEETFVDESGNVVKRLVPAAKVVPGDEVLWTITARNVCELPAADVTIGSPVPEHMRYVADTAFGQGTVIEYSLDGAAFAAPEALLVVAADGSERPARAAEYRHIRWRLSRPLGASQALVVGYRAAVN